MGVVRSLWAMLKSIVTTIWYRSFIWVWSSTPEHAEINSQYWITNMSRLNWGMMSILYIWVKETNWGSFFKWFNSLTLAFLCTVEIMIQHYLKGKLSFDTGVWWKEEILNEEIQLKLRVQKRWICFCYSIRKNSDNFWSHFNSARYGKQ